MNRMHVPSIPDPSSPWYALSEWRKPNVKWCEAQTNTWIIEPANFWSNFSYLLAALWISKNSQQYKSRAIRSYAWVMVVMGLCSAIYHGSYTFVFQIFDFFGMYLMTTLMLLIQMKRLGWISSAMSPRNFWSWVLGTTAFTVWCDFYTEFPIQFLILIQTAVVILSEFLIRARSKTRYNMKWFYLGFGFMTLAATFSFLDLKRILCDPNNHLLQGHSLWHLFSAIGLTFTYVHHAQFDEELQDEKISFALQEGF